MKLVFNVPLTESNIRILGTFPASSAANSADVSLSGPAHANVLCSVTHGFFNVGGVSTVGFEIFLASPVNATPLSSYIFSSVSLELDVQVSDPVIVKAVALTDERRQITLQVA